MPVVDADEAGSSTTSRNGAVISTLTTMLARQKVALASSDPVAFHSLYLLNALHLLAADAVRLRLLVRFLSP